MSAYGPGCVKTLFESRFGANLLDFRKLQFAKALISLKLKFGRFGFNLDLIRSLTFSHSLASAELEMSDCGPNLKFVEGAEHVRSAPVIQMSTCSAISSASSISIPRYLTVLSIFVCPSSN